MFDRKVSVQEMEMHEIEDTMTNGKYKQKAKKKIKQDVNEDNRIHCK